LILYVNTRLDAVRDELKGMHEDIREIRSDVKLLTGNVYEMIGGKTLMEDGKIKLPMRAEGGETIWRTLRGEWLVGRPGRDGTPGVGRVAERSDRERWGTSDYWFIMRAESGKLVVYREPLNEDGSPVIAIYADFEAMQPHVPPSLYRRALEEAGLAKPPEYREVPLDV
jgi:hypothetical protein